jgi:hypothetical protein
VHDPRETITEQNENALFLTGHDNALIGVGQRCGQLALAVYDNAVIRSNLMAEGMDETDAIEFFDFNILGGWHGENTPILMEPCSGGIMNTVHMLRAENRKLMRRIAEYEAREH